MHMATVSEYYHSLKTLFTHFIVDVDVYSLSSCVCGVLLLAFLVRKSRRSAKEPSNSSRCTLPSCARCRGETEIQGKLQQRLREHVRCLYDVQPRDLPAYLSLHYARIQAAIESYDHKTETLSSIYRESGYSDVPTQRLAHVWTMPALRRQPLWGLHADMDSAVIEKLFSTFEDSGNFESILQEYRAVADEEDAWRENNVSTGSWNTYFLMNQGRWVEENTGRCPQTVRLLLSTGCLMEGTVFGNVLFSVLKSGSSIEPHTGPCNFRLRCHLSLNASSGFSIRVGEHTTTWRDGQLLVFDDSFVHSVWHKVDSEEQCSHPADSSSFRAVEDRVVLIFDIWHPDTNRREQQALQCMFE